jgi:hypothetical protein
MTPRRAARWDGVKRRAQFAEHARLRRTVDDRINARHLAAIEAAMPALRVMLGVDPRGRGKLQPLLAERLYRQLLKMPRGAREMLPVWGALR